MSKMQPSPAIKNILRPIVTGLLFAAYFLYIAVVIRPDFLYYALITDGGYVYPPFLKGFDFFADALHHPGGISWYLSSFLFQTYANQWIGAFAVMLAALCSFGVSRAMLCRFFGYPIELFAYVPAIVALVVMNRYGDPLPLLTNYNLSLALSLLYIDWAVRQTTRHWALFPICFGIVYYCTGGGALLSAILVVIYAFEHERRGPHTAAVAIASLVAALLLYRYCNLRAVLQYALVTGGYPERRILTDTTYIIDVPAVIVSAFMALCVLAAYFLHTMRKPARTTVAAGVLSNTLGTAVALLLMAGCLAITRDDGRRIKVAFEYLDRIGRPGDVLEMVDRLEPARLDRLVLFDLNRALSRRGLLGEKMFSYPQNPDALTIENPAIKFRVPVLMRKAGFYLELGYLNLSKASLAELFEGSRIEHPAVIELTGKNALAHGRPAIGAMWYRRLSRDLNYGKKGREVLRYLATGAPFPGLDTLELLRKNAIKHDTVVTILDIQNFCTALVAENPGNRMAYDYLVGGLLLNGKLPEAARLLQRFSEAGYRQLPKNWAEALILYGVLNTVTDSTLTSAVPPDVTASLMRFMAACRSLKQHYEQFDRSAERYASEAPSALRQEFGSTYFYYYFFHMSGASRWYR